MATSIMCESGLSRGPHRSRDARVHLGSGKCFFLSTNEKDYVDTYYLVSVLRRTENERNQIRKHTGNTQKASDLFLSHPSTPIHNAEHALKTPSGGRGTSF